MMGESLNIGCGKTLFGDVRLDVDRLSCANIIGDAQFLPFRDKVFRLAYASHVLEHVKQPYVMLSEMKRVSTSLVVLRVPNAIHQFEDCAHEQHLFMWNKTLFERLLSTVFPSVEVRYSVNMQVRKSRYVYLWGILFNILVRIFHNELIAYCKVEKK